MAQTIAEMLIEKGRKQGEEKGRREGTEQEAVRSRQETLVRLLRKRFGKVPAKVVKRVEATSAVAQLQAWLDQFATAQQLADVGIPPLD